MPGEPEEAGSAGFGSAESREIGAPLQNDCRYGGEGFDVIENRGRLISARNRWERWPNPRIAALAFEGFEQGRLFTAFVSAGTRVRREVERNASPQDIFAQVAACVGFFDRTIHDCDQISVFAANVDITLLRADREARDQNSFDQLVRIVLH